MELKPNKFALNFIKYNNLLMHILFRVKFVGRENIPDSGNYIFAANHITILDPFYVGLGCRKELYYMAKSDLFKNKLLAAFLRKMNAFPVKRDTSDRASLRRAEEIIKSGGSLGIFPEGRCNLDADLPKRAKAGIGFLASRCKCPVIPISLYNEKKGRLFSKLTVRFGEPISCEEMGIKETGRNDYQQIADVIMDRIIKLWGQGHA